MFVSRYSIIDVRKRLTDRGFVYLSYKAVQFKRFWLSVKTSCPPTEDIDDTPALISWWVTNRPFPSSLVPLFHNESKCETFHMKMSSACSFIFMQIKVISIRMVSHLDSPWNRGTRELGNGLLSKGHFFCPSLIQASKIIIFYLCCRNTVMYMYMYCKTWSRLLQDITTNSTIIQL